MSKSNRFPQGLANSSGMVGKHLMFNYSALTLGTFEHPLNEFKSIQVTRVVQDFYEIDPKHGLLRGRRHGWSDSFLSRELRHSGIAARELQPGVLNIKLP